MQIGFMLFSLILVALVVIGIFGDWWWGVLIFLAPIILLTTIISFRYDLIGNSNVGSQINTNSNNQNLSTNVYQAEEGDASTPDVSDVMRNLTSRIGSLENSIETIAILRKQKEEIEKDLKKYVTGYNLSIFRMAALDLIDAYEYLSEALEMLEKASFPESKEISRYFDPVSMYLKQGLAAVGIEQFTPDKQVPYLRNPGCDLSERIPTIDKEKEGLIADVEKAGWRSTLPTNSTQKEILRNAQVSVFERLEK